MPDSSPTAKQLLSLLNATDSTAVGFDASMDGRTFMMRAEEGSDTGTQGVARKFSNFYRARFGDMSALDLVGTARSSAGRKT